MAHKEISCSHAPTIHKLRIISHSAISYSEFKTDFCNHPFNIHELRRSTRITPISPRHPWGIVNTFFEFAIIYRNVDRIYSTRGLHFFFQGHTFDWIQTTRTQSLLKRNNTFEQLLMDRVWFGAEFIPISAIETFSVVI
jgi:hypothetical protein